MKFCALRNVSLLRQCRAVSSEVGSLSEVWAMPTEVRTWWLGEMERERQAGEGHAPELRADGRRIVSADVPRQARR